MVDHARPIPVQSRNDVWVVGPTTTLVALGLGYYISLHPAWLRMGFDLTRREALLGLLAGALIAIAALKWPQSGLLGLVALLYANVSEVGVRAHGLPSVLQLLWPVLLFAVIGSVLVTARHTLVWDPVMVWLVVYGAVMFASSAGAASPRLADGALLEYGLALLLVFVIVNLLTSERALRRVAWVMLLVGVFLGTISMHQVLTSSYDFLYGGFGRTKMAGIVGRLWEPRIAGPLSDPNFYGQILLVLVPVAFYRLWDEASLRLKAVAAYALWVILLALEFTYSRGAALGLVVVLLLAAVHKKRLVHLSIALLILLPLLLVLPRQFGDRLRTIRQLLPTRTESSIHLDSSFQGRVLVMRTAWEMFLDHPWLGVGVGNYSEHYDEYSERVGSIASSYENFSQRRLPHNLYLEVAAETGLMGLAAFGAILAGTLLSFWSAYRAFSARGDHCSASVAMSLALGFVGYLVSSLFLHGQYMRYFWLLVAMAIGAKQIAQGDKGSGTEDREPKTARSPDSRAWR